jgi:dCTP deaminase
MDALRSYVLPELRPDLIIEEKQAILNSLAFNIIENTICEALKKIDVKIKEKIPKDKCNLINLQVFKASNYLKSDIPPCEVIENRILEKPKNFEMRSILLSSWTAWLSKSKNSPEWKTHYQDRKNLSKLSLRAIELAHLQSQYKPKNPEQIEIVYSENKRTFSTIKTRRKQPGVLNKDEILYYMNNADLDKAIILTPLFDPRQIGESSLDVRLGNSFIISKRASIKNIEVTENLEDKDKIKAYESQEKVQIELEDKDGIALHPGQFILGSTLEYIKLPLDIMAYVIGKSSVGRLGLVIATATQIAPGYKGTPTLELSNVGNVPLILHPTELIAQLVFHKLCAPVKKGYEGEYSISVGPEFSKYLQIKLH